MDWLWVVADACAGSGCRGDNGRSRCCVESGSGRCVGAHYPRCAFSSLHRTMPYSPRFPSSLLIVHSPSPADRQVLDIGCGPGALLETLVIPSSTIVEPPVRSRPKNSSQGQPPSPVDSADDEESGELFIAVSEGVHPSRRDDVLTRRFRLPIPTRHCSTLLDTARHPPCCILTPPCSIRNVRRTCSCIAASHRHEHSYTASTLSLRIQLFTPRRRS
jgi:hypothetical protein